MASALSSLRYGDSLSVVGISAVTAVLCEAISWLLIYRTATYNSLRASIERHSRKLDAMKSGAAGSSSSSGGGAALRLVAGEEDGPRRDQPQGRRAGALARQAQVRRRRRRRALRRLRPPQLPLRGPHRRQAALRARPARPADEPPRPARERPHRLLHGLPLLPLLHEHPDQPPETAWIRPAVRGCCGRRGTLPHARSQSQLSLFVDSSARYRIVAAEYLGEGAVVQPQWLQFMREWGPTVVYKSRKRMEWMVGRLPPRLRCRAESMLNKMPNELSREEGPTGPKEKNNWEGDERW